MPTGYKMTHDDFIGRVAELSPHIEVLGRYTRQKDKIECKCTLDGHKWSPQAGDLIKGHGCPKCKARKITETRRKSHEQFLEELSFINPNIQILSEYQGANRYVKCRCPIHNIEWDSKPSNLLSGRGCTKCGYEVVANKLLARTPEEFLEEVSALHPTIEILSLYHRVDDSLLCKCRLDGYEWVSSGKRLLRGDGCPKCSGKARVTHEEFVQRMEKINPDIEIVGEYRGSHSHIACWCRVCGHEWSAEPHNLYAGWSCPGCSRSHGERVISQYLRFHNYVFDEEHSFNDCKFEKTLFFDFYLPELSTVIEYDGEQHFRPVKFGGANDTKAELRFELNQKRDAIKNEYCKANKIRMIRIPYTDFDHIEEILDELLA